MIYLALAANALKDGRLTVGFIGGSITHAGRDKDGGHSWRTGVTQFLRDSYPEAEIRDIMAAYSGTGSDLGAARFDSDVLAHGTPHLLFVEYAVNDGRSAESLRRGMEGIVRKAKRARPGCDVVFIYTTHEGAQGGSLKSVAEHAKVAAHYRIPEIDVGCEIWKRIADGRGAWADYISDYAHPNAKGHAVYIGKIAAYLKEALIPGPVDVSLPEPLERENMENAGLIFAADCCEAPFTVEQYPSGGYLFRLACCDAPGAKVRVPFAGRTVGVYWRITEYTGDLLWRVDDGEWQCAPTWDGWVEQYPDRMNYRTLADRLSNAEHAIELCVAGTRDPKAKGCGIQIAAVFCSGAV